MDWQEPFKVSGKDVFLDSLYHARTGWLIWISIILFFIVMATGGLLKDTRILSFGVLCLLTITPTISFFLYYYHLFASETVVNVMPHTLERTESGYTLHIFKRVPEQEDNDGPRDIWMVSGRISVMDSSLVRVRRIPNYTVLQFEGAPIGSLYVPAEMPIQINYENIKEQ